MDEIKDPALTTPSGQDGAALFDEPGLPGLAAPKAAAPYRVLARKYRPRSFDDLIGQEAMVRTLSNAFESGRIPQAWMLTGVRGVGKTTTARILARALNYQAPGSGRETGRPTIQMPTLGEHCESIIEGRHIDVMEIDAASSTGVDNIRQINDAVRYAPALARYKVYIVDEVHMLSSGAFNAFLKTLEEPPPHAKFVFATTEIRKVPVTILSRCQRFDLRRVEASALVAHLARIAEAEKVAVEDEALRAVARAAEGSVRDALSLLDQAIAHGAGSVTAAGVRDMLGLADRSQVIDLFEAVMRGDVPAAFAGIRAQFEAGADPALVLSDLASFTHLVTRMKLAPGAAKDPVLTEDERRRGATLAESLSTPTLSRAWQMLLKAIPEVQSAARPLAAAEMALVRLCYVADLPGPEEVLRRLADGASSQGTTPGAHSAPMPPQPDPAPARASVSHGALALAAETDRPIAVARPVAEPAIRLRRFEDVVAMAAQKREIGLKTALERDVRLVRFEEGRIEFGLAEGSSRSLPNDLARALDQWTGRRWVVALSSDQGAPTLREASAAAAEERRSDAASHPLVKAVQHAFPGAEIVDVRTRDEGPAAAVSDLDEAASAAVPDPEAESDDDL